MPAPVWGGDSMEGFDPKVSFGYETSKRYDVLETRGDEEQTVAFLARLAGQREALEFAVGTGRIALPLTRAGVRVHGIEQSQHMVDRMREKLDGEKVDVFIGDMTRVDTGSQYGLVYLVYNTIGNLLSQDESCSRFQDPAGTAKRFGRTPGCSRSWLPVLRLNGPLSVPISSRTLARHSQLLDRKSTRLNS